MNHPMATSAENSTKLPCPASRGEALLASAAQGPLSPAIAEAALAGASPDDLAAVLAAWDSATHRLQETHHVLCREIQRLTEELEAKNRQLARKDRLAELGRMASHVAHEVRNSLMPVTLSVSLLKRRLADDVDSRPLIDRLTNGLAAVGSAVDELLQFSGDRMPCPTCFAVRPLLVDIVDSLAPQLAAQHVVVELSVDESAVCTADRDMLRRAVLNLVLNALDALPHGGRLEVAAVSSVAGLVLEVADNGNGIPADTLPRLFEPFFTTKSGGTGLGLAIVQRIAEVHGGEVMASNRLTGGAAFTIHLPPRYVKEAA